MATDKREWFLPDNGIYSDGTIPVLAMSARGMFEQICIVGPGPKDTVMATAEEIVSSHNHCVLMEKP